MANQNLASFNKSKLLLFSMPTTLSNLNIVALDCQTTGANPSRGHILEMGWVRTRASAKNLVGESAVQVFPIRLPAETTIPRAVQRITGISAKDLEAGLSSKAVWNRLLAAANSPDRNSPRGVCPAVIHFSRFEEPFLRDLHRRNSPAGPFPFRIICTHEIAVRLLPDLPRRGLRAIAGYYGHCMPELKRSGDHAVATAFVWQKMVHRLESTCGITTLAELVDWLADTRPAGRSKRAFPMDPDIRRQLPDQPGIYRMLRANGDSLYIGKAKSLRQRVNSYFRPKAPHAEHILEMLTQARDLKITLTDSALEAAILESDEIKRHSPPYNIALRRRQRRLTFCSKDFARQAQFAHRKFPLGPLPAGKTTEALAGFDSWLKGGMQIKGAKDKNLGYSVLALAPEYAPDVDCVQAGFEMFRSRYRRRLAKQSSLRFLTGLGAELWRERLKAAASSEAAEAQQDEIDGTAAQRKEIDNEQVWSPEAVAGAIERMVLHSAHLIRRARWFCLLSESCLAWAPAGQPAKNKNLVVFEKGAVLRRDDMQPSSSIPTPPGFARSFQARQNNIDLTTYDRLRVVTTDLRRLVSEGRKVELKLGPRKILGTGALVKALRWV